jgi:hypothetical protein
MLKKIFCAVLFVVFFVNAQNVLVNSIIAELKVGASQISGEAKGLLSDEENLKKEAVGEAIKYGADVLVDVRFVREEYEDSLLITAMGYPACYTNFNLLNQNEPNNKDYFSIRYQYAISSIDRGYYYNHNKTCFHHAGGGIIEVGRNIRGFFVSGDISGGVRTFGCGVSLGALLQPTDKFQIGLGYSGGIWFFIEKRYSPPWNSGGIYGIYPGYYNYYFYPAVHGPFAKMLFGKDKYWFEINYRFLFGAPPEDYSGNQISLGFTYLRKRRYFDKQ